MVFKTNIVSKTDCKELDRVTVVLKIQYVCTGLNGISHMIFLLHLSNLLIFGRFNDVFATFFGTNIE